MFYDHIEEPPYFAVESLPPADPFDWQVIGNLQKRDRDQSHDMYAGGFWADARKYLCLLHEAETVAWLGFTRRGGGGIVTIEQLQGRRDCELLCNGWPEQMLRTFVSGLDPTQIHTVKILPARLSPWWSNNKAENIHALRGRLITYYDRIPKRIGFDLASVAEQTLFRSATARHGMRAAGEMPYHTLKLER